VKASFLEKIAILCFWGRLKVHYFWICIVHLSRIDSWIRNMSRIRPNIQALPRHIHTLYMYCRQHRRNTFFVFWGTKTCKSVTIIRKIFFSITMPSHMWYVYLKVKSDLQRRQVKIHWSMILLSYVKSRFTRKTRAKTFVYVILYILILIFLGRRW
jgi:hypothetical protein